MITRILVVLSLGIASNGLAGSVVVDRCKQYASILKKCSTPQPTILTQDEVDIIRACQRLKPTVSRRGAGSTPVGICGGLQVPGEDVVVSPIDRPKPMPTPALPAVNSDGSLDPASQSAKRCKKQWQEFVDQCSQESAAIIAPPVSCLQQANLDFKLCMSASKPEAVKPLQP